MNILSIQSQVAWGHVGNTAAVFPLQRLGAEVWAVPTVLFSNHPGHGGFRGQVLAPGLIRELLAGMAERGALAGCDAVLSGYVGSLDVAEAVLEGVAQVKAANPMAWYCLDPVMGDAGRVYVRPGIPEFLRDRTLAMADIVTPNQFELELLSGRAVTTLAQAKAAMAELQALGPRCVLVTSVSLADTPAHCLDLLAAEAGACWRLRTPRLMRHFSGAGDTIAALFLFHRLATGSARAALEAAASATHGLLRRTAEAGAAELLTVAAQNEFVAPSWRFAAEAC